MACILVSDLKPAHLAGRRAPQTTAVPPPGLHLRPPATQLPAARRAEQGEGLEAAYQPRHHRPQGHARNSPQHLPGQARLPPTLAALPSATARSAESGRQDDRIRSRTRQPLTSGAGHTRPRHNYRSGAPSTASQPTGLARITAALGAGALGRGATLHSQAGDRHRWLQGFLHGPDCGGWRWLRLRCSSRQ